MAQLWEIRYGITHFYVSNIPFPTEQLVLDDDILLVKRDKGCTACLALESEYDDVFLFGEAENVLQEIANVYALVSGFSVELDSQGATGIKSLEELGIPKPILDVKTEALYSPDKAKELSAKLLNHWQMTKRIWRKLRERLEQENALFLKLALLYYFQSGRSSMPIEEAFVDAAMGLEAMFNDGPQDIRYKLAVRGAMVLFCSGHPDAKDSFTTLKKLYDKRNKLVHGSERSVDPDDLRLIRSLLRGCLRACLGLGLSMNKPQINELIDEAMIEPEARKKLETEISEGFSSLGLINGSSAL
jgi:hypothetical protein